jgi:MFS transporter
LIVAVTAQAVGSLWFLSQRATEPPAKGRAAAQEQTGQSHVLRNGALVVTALTCLVLGGLFGANDVAIVASATEHGHKNLSGAILACFSTGSLVAALIHGSRQWHWPLQRQFVVGVTVLALGASTLIFAPNLWFVAVAAAITGMAIAPTFTTANQIVQHSVADNQITEGLTWLSTTINVGVSVGTFLAGLAIDNSGAHGGFLAVTVMSWLAVVIAWSGARTLRRTLGVRQIP